MTDQEKFERILKENGLWTYADQDERFNVYNTDAFKAMQSAFEMGRQEVNVNLKKDADTMFDALYAIISDMEVDNLDKCMKVAGDAINALIDKTRADTNHR